MWLIDCDIYRATTERNDLFRPMNRCMCNRWISFCRVLIADHLFVAVFFFFFFFEITIGNRWDTRNGVVQFEEGLRNSSCWREVVLVRATCSSLISHGRCVTNISPRLEDDLWSLFVTPRDARVWFSNVLLLSRAIDRHVSTLLYGNEEILSRSTIRGEKLSSRIPR